jgi:hypothetical protein
MGVGDSCCYTLYWRVIEAGETIHLPMNFTAIIPARAASDCHVAKF